MQNERKTLSHWTDVTSENSVYRVSLKEWDTLIQEKLRLHRINSVSNIDITFDVTRGYNDDDLTISITLESTRLEKDHEMEARLEREKAEKRRAEQRQKKVEASFAAQERELYERLKAKFEPKQSKCRCSDFGECTCT